ncbi:MAG: hypothetical protein DWQ34_16360 [Planctomycetota bacterium]|nr:MAG: hypothetical protein DWQ34_16360 [Planctomycetota bacterium]
MTRFVFSSCGVLAEVVAFDTAGPPLKLGLATLGLIVGASAWWTELSQLIDQIVGLDLPHVDAPQRHTETD